MRLRLHPLLFYAGIERVEGLGFGRAKRIREEIGWLC